MIEDKDDDYNEEISEARGRWENTYGVGPGPLPIIDLRGGEQECIPEVYGPKQKRLGDQLRERREFKKQALRKEFEAKRKNMDEAEGRVVAKNQHVGAGRVRFDVTNSSEGRGRQP